MNPQKLMSKAERSATSAKLLFDAGDIEGACDRAYYAMFNSARAALIAADVMAQEDLARTHGGLISAFSLHLVKTEKVPLECGQNLNKVEELRLIADYKGEPIEPEIAKWAVDKAQEFIKIMKATIGL